MDGESIAEQIAKLAEEDREAILAELDPSVIEHDPEFWLRTSQLEALRAVEWLIVMLAGRGAGKTRTGAEWVREQARIPMTRIALVARTVGDVRDTMVQGESGIMAIHPPSEMPEYTPSLRRLSWPNGAVATTFCLDEGTMAFTPEGWKTHNQLAPGDLLYTLNPSTGVAEWQPATAINRFTVQDEPVALVGGSGHKYLNVRATMTHRWVVHRRGGVRELSIVPTTGLRPKMRIPTAARCGSVPDEPTYCDELVSVMGWFLAEGHVTKSGTVVIAQHRRSNPDNWEVIYNLLALLYGPPSDYMDSPGRSRGPRWKATDTHFHLNARASWEITDHLEDRGGKWIQPEFIHNLTANQLEIFVEAAVLGDGHRRPERSDCWTVTQAVSPLTGSAGGLIEALDCALTLLGVPHTLSEHRADYRGDSYPMRSITRLGDRREPTRGSSHVEDRYTGIVWCPTTPNGTWLAMHKDGHQAFFTGNSAEKPSQLRGPQFHKAWADELASWRLKPDDSGLNAWDNLQIACRLGINPQIFTTTTPKRVQTIRQLVNMAKSEPRKVRLIRGSTMDNAANLAAVYLETIIGKYAGTSIERQELYGELLDAVEGALWVDELIERFRTYDIGSVQDDTITVVAVDPSVAEKPGDECGIVVVRGTRELELHHRHGWVLDDRSLLGSPEVWANKVIEAAKDWSADAVVAEQNQGGALVRMVLNGVDPSIPVVLVSATKGKAIRAEPVVLAYEQGRVHHVGRHVELEDEMTGWVPGESGYSPNRLDALVWGMTALMVDPAVLRSVSTDLRAVPISAMEIQGAVPQYRRRTMARSSFTIRR